MNRTWKFMQFVAAAPSQYKVDNSTQLKAPIVNLARLILDFTGNPFFRETGVVGADACQARRDLEAIIEISSTVKELSKKLSESGATGQTPQRSIP